MFESVLERNLPPRQIGRGAGLAIGVHAVVIAGAMYFSARPAPVIEKEIHAVKVLTQAPRVLGQGPVREGAGTQADRSKTPRRPAVRQTPIDIDKNRSHVEESTSSAAISNHGGHATDEVGSAGEAPGPVGGKGEGGGASIGGGTTIAIPFGEGMTRPAPLAQPAPVYTREASAAHAQGTVSVRCVITVEGTLQNCRVIHGVPFMDGAVLEALSRWRYTPVMFQGRPASVYYVINLRLVAP